jgi:hypothetical protein
VIRQLEQDAVDLVIAKSLLQSSLALERKHATLCSLECPSKAFYWCVCWYIAPAQNFS